MGKWLVLMGGLIMLVGLMLMVIERFGFPSLPLDFRFRVGNLEVFLPIGTSILLTLMLNLVIWVFLWLTRG